MIYKKITLIVLAILICSYTYASHEYGDIIKVEHISGFDYEIKLEKMRDPSGIPSPLTDRVFIVPRDSISNIITFIDLDLVSSEYWQFQNCSGQFPGFVGRRQIFSKSFYFDPAVYNNPSGYYIISSIVAASALIPSNIDLMNNAFGGLTLIPPVIDSIGNPIVNSSPEVKTPFDVLACQGNLFYEDFSGIDPDGDSIVYKLYTPFGGMNSTNPTITTISDPYLDPTSQYSKGSWQAGYSVDDQIHGAPGPNPSTNRFKIDPQSGIVTLIANEPQGQYLYGIWTQEFRSGRLIGSVFRQFPLFIADCSAFPNSDPQIYIQPDTAISWSNDTVHFSASPVCLDLSIYDTDTSSVFFLDVLNSTMDESEYYFTLDSGVGNSNIVFNSSLCFDPDSFSSSLDAVEILAFNPDCGGMQIDTLSFWVNFINYSNAGLGGNIQIPITPSLSSIDLFSLLTKNPNPGGTWVDIDQSGLLNANNEFIANYINNPVSFRFYYIDQQPNFPADTAELTLNFVENTSLETKRKDEIKIYPNPSSGRINIIANEWQLGQTYYIYNAQMQLVKKGIFESQHNQIDLDRHEMFYLIINSRNTITKKFIIH